MRGNREFFTHFPLISPILFSFVLCLQYYIYPFTPPFTPFNPRPPSSPPFIPPFPRVFPGSGGESVSAVAAGSQAFCFWCVVVVVLSAHAHSKGPEAIGEFKCRK